MRLFYSHRLDYMAYPVVVCCEAGGSDQICLGKPLSVEDNNISILYYPTYLLICDRSCHARHSLYIYSHELFQNCGRNQYKNSHFWEYYEIYNKIAVGLLCNKKNSILIHFSANIH